MPKIKTDKGAHKRFKKKDNGFTCNHCNHRHIMTQTSTKRKRHLRAMSSVHKSDLRNIVNLLPYA